MLNKARLQGDAMSSKYQREIEDILEQAGEVGARPPSHPPRGYSFRRLVWLYVKQLLGGKALSISPGRVMLVGFVLLLATLLVRPFVAGITGYLAWAGLLLFIIGYGMVLARPPRVDKRWRGKSIEDARGSWLERVRRMVRGRPRG